MQEQIEKEFEKEICDFCKENKEHQIKDCGMETKALNPHWVLKRITKAYQQGREDEREYIRVKLRKGGISSDCIYQDEIDDILQP